MEKEVKKFSDMNMEEAINTFRCLLDQAYIGFKSDTASKIVVIKSRLGGASYHPYGLQSTSEEELKALEYCYISELLSSWSY